jgi:hypothetical protein
LLKIKNNQQSSKGEEMKPCFFCLLAFLSLSFQIFANDDCALVAVKNKDGAWNLFSQKTDTSTITAQNSSSFCQTKDVCTKRCRICRLSVEGGIDSLGVIMAVAAPDSLVATVTKTKSFNHRPFWLIRKTETTKTGAIFCFNRSQTSASVIKASVLETAEKIDFWMIFFAATIIILSSLLALLALTRKMVGKKIARFLIIFCEGISIAVFIKGIASALTIGSFFSLFSAAILATAISFLILPAFISFPSEKRPLKSKIIGLIALTIGSLSLFIGGWTNSLAAMTFYFCLAIALFCVFIVLPLPSAADNPEKKK